MTSIGIGLPQGIEQGANLAALLRYVDRALEAGFDSLWVQDQVFGSLARLEPLATLAAISPRSGNAWLGAGVVVLPTRDPIELARTAATLSHLTAGRFICGLAGGARGVATRAGIDPDTRLSRLRDAVVLMRHLWSDHQVTWAGEYARVEAAAISPPAHMPPPPVWIGASSPAGLRTAVEIGDGWIGAGSATSTQFAAQLSRVEERLSMEHRSRSNFTVAKRLYVHIARSGRARRRVEDWFGAYYGRPDLSAAAAVGSAADCGEAAMDLRDSGTDLVILSPVIDEEAQLEALATDVLPQLVRGSVSDGSDRHSQNELL